MTWWQALIDAGAVPGAGGRGDEPEAGERADLVEGNELQAHPIPEPRIPNPVSFLNGIERWSVVAYDGVVQVVSAYIAAAVRRRDAGGVLHTSGERARAFAIAPLDRMSAPLRRALEQSASDLERVDSDLVEQPARYLEMVEATVRRARAHLERELAEQSLKDLGADEWVVVDGLVSRSAAGGREPRAPGGIKWQGTQ